MLNLYQKENLNSIAPVDPKKVFFDTYFEIEQLESKGAKNIKIKTKRNCRYSKYQLQDKKTPSIDVFVKDDSKYFSFAVLYLKDGFKYYDYWIGYLVPTGAYGKNGDFYNVKLVGPYSFWKHCFYKLKGNKY